MTKQLLRHEGLLGHECLLWSERGETRPISGWNLGNDMLDGSGNLVVGYSYSFGWRSAMFRFGLQTAISRGVTSVSTGLTQ